jgi:hypothetical protein
MTEFRPRCSVSVRGADDDVPSSSRRMPEVRSGQVVISNDRLRSCAPLSISVFRSTVTRKIPFPANRDIGSKRRGSNAGLRAFASHRVIGAETTVARCGHYGGRPAADQASAIGSASTGGSPTAAQNLAALNEGSSASTCSATAFASSMRPSLASAAASRLWDTLKLGTDCTARRAACAASS